MDPDNKSCPCISSHLFLCFPQYDIDKVYHRSISENHPRECLEASFDIVFDDRSVQGEHFEAECIMVVNDVFRIIRSTFKRETIVLSEHVRLASPCYYLRLNHTRLADAILDICYVPSKEITRKACFHILTLSACSPLIAVRIISGAKTSSDETDAIMKDIDVHLVNAITRSGLPEESAKRLRIVLEGCMPSSGKFLETLAAIDDSMKRLHVADLKGVQDARRLKKHYEVAAKSLSSLRSFYSILESFESTTLVDTMNGKAGWDNIHLPVYISIDLGLRHRRKLHGPLIFHAIILPDNYFQSNADATILSSKGGIVADGGRYDDLVLRFSPPGNVNCVPMVRFNFLFY